MFLPWLPTTADFCVVPKPEIIVYDVGQVDEFVFAADSTDTPNLLLVILLGGKARLFAL